MIEICDSNKCTGCALCVDVCPKNAISLQLNNRGYWTPVIDKDLCIDCGACVRNCIANAVDIKEKLSLPSKMYKAYTNNTDERRTSSSGGMFFALAKYFIDNNGYVFGAAMNDEFRAYHCCARNIEELQKLKQSKYVGSNMSGIYKTIKELVKHGEQVMFVGTPCQSFALKKYVGNNDNLLIVDLICHGVNSYRVLDHYISDIETKYKAKCIRFSFRNKIKNYMQYEYAATLDNGKVVSRKAFINYCGNLFGGRKTTKVACDNCMFASKERTSDITLADYTYLASEKQPKDELVNGVSLVLVNTQKGNDYFDRISDKIFYKDVTNYDYLAKRITHSTQYNTEEKNKMLDELANDTDAFIKKYFNLSFRDKLNIKYAGPLTGNPIQLIVKCTNKAINFAKRIIKR